MEKFVYTFLKNTYLFQLTTKVKQISPSKTQGEVLVTFNDSIFHPQGGGQPNDKGYITFDDKKLQILGGVTNRETGQVRQKLMQVEYKFKQPILGLSVGKEIMMHIDPEERKKNAKLHSAGHILDVAVHNLKLPWKPSKGYHFQDSPYVQYVGQVGDVGQLKTKLQEQLNKILKQAQPVVISEYSKQEGVNRQLIDPSFLGDRVRVIKVFEDQCACGGTHIENVSQISQIEITKINKKSKNIRVSYKI